MIQDLLTRGEDFFSSGDMSMAKACFRQIVEMDPGHTDALNNLGVIAFHEGLLDNASLYFRRALDSMPDNVEVLENLAKCLVLEQEFSEAVLLYERITALGHINTNILNSMGFCLLQLGRLKSAYEVYKRSFEIDSTQKEVRSVLLKLDSGNRENADLMKRPLQKREYLLSKERYGIQIFSFVDFESDLDRRLRWGDYWVKMDLEEAIRKLGHEIVHSSPDITLHMFGVPVTPSELPDTSYRVLWIHSHPDLISPSFLMKYDKIFCLSPTFCKKIRDWGFDADLLVGGTSKEPVHREERKFLYDIVFVGNAKGPFGRKIVMDLGIPTYRFKVWGEGWENILPQENLGGIYYDNRRLPELYASSAIVLNDHHEDMRREGFLNPRILDVFASGSLVISDPIEGVESIFGDVLPTYHTPQELRTMVDFYINNPLEREKVIERGRAITSRYTFDKMVRSLLDML